MHIRYAPFYSLIRLLASRKITRKRFVIEWEIRQKEQGLTAREEQDEAAGII